MPAGPANTAAPTPPTSVSDANVPQEPMPFEQFAGPGPVPTNQSTTKPRQIPGGGSQPGLGEDVGMDPDSNGSDVGTGEPPKPDGPPVQAVRHSAYVLSDIMAEIVEANPHLGERGAYHLAKRVLDEYPLTKQADDHYWNPLEHGRRSRVPDGPLTKALHKGRQPVPANSPSRQQPTIQPEHRQHVLEAGPALEGGVVQPRSIEQGPQAIEHPRTMVMAPDGSWDWDRPDPYDQGDRP